ncbi:MULTISPECIES: AbrB/MazE/SpoVT family DNA-binding domain-containing protein [Bacillus]|uniref:AbrB/MazE/SpoVT family DNA-binding domain-containing protein n=1 Tax=Bacillus pseudomycoides TaxID=64104 RepID=A0AAJ2DMG6_9BACI|nr:AbrB/MazE/SpoVT family DNA-binding domain-containing protein [Bacillus pseudomycoides]EEM10616.1 Transcriptional pleiotropic regulator of transition state genes [Bacillus pseudomycoides]MCR8861168.1 AbrB/MazE/SpoVT family DNA-binding domain-containing protein [Bacillus pseudomycoides]MDR4329304.1 AbrB/MazE/SpoVT family DNA-binding domain-containing protein [Bacillus pseudomycoides]MED1534536.1 AbrB/MazE/SpoVT family DNA-binding domain-containing protein [Bacillus pseudomycoides]MED1625314.1
MKSTGVMRKVDELGRVVIPKELRRTLAIQEKTPLEIYVEGEKIILKKYEANGACAITGEVTDKNISVADGKITLSPAGAELIIEELQKNLVK